MSGQSKSKKRGPPESDGANPSKKTKPGGAPLQFAPSHSTPPQPASSRSALLPSASSEPAPRKPDLPRIDIIGAFESFSQGLATLLHPSISQDVLSETFGEAKSNFLLALRSMRESGELQWLTAMPFVQPPPKFSPPVGQKWPPPLPKVRNPHLQRQIFTHRSHIHGQHASAYGVEHAHYERLEYLGDAYLQVITSHILFDRFAAYREGGLSEMRQRIVCNSNLATYAELYNMHRAFRGSKGKDIYQKSIADSFEAYVGAIIVDRDTIEQGMLDATVWLIQLFEPKIQEMEQQRGAVLMLDKNAKQNLHLLVHGENVKLEYRWTDGGGGNQGGYWISAFLNGWGFEEKELGKGWGNKKVDGEIRAAMSALRNEEIVKEIQQAKSKKGKPWKPKKHESKGAAPKTDVVLDY